MILLASFRIVGMSAILSLCKELREEPGMLFSVRRYEGAENPLDGYETVEAESAKGGSRAGVWRTANRHRCSDETSCHGAHTAPGQSPLYVLR